MKAIVFHGVGDVRLEEVAEPRIHHPTDAIVRITASAVSGIDLHAVRGTLPGMKPGTILGREGVGIVEQAGPEVRSLRPGDRVVIPPTICCGVCSYCRAGYTSQCDNANPHGKDAGAAFYGGPESTGPFHGLQAEKARIPHASANLVKLPDSVSDDQALLLCDAFPTGYFAADMAKIKPGRTVAVFGCGPAGQFAIASAKLLDAGRIFAVDAFPARLEMAEAQGAEVVDFAAEDPVEALMRLTDGIGVDRSIDAAGVDAAHPGKGRPRKDGDRWEPGDAPDRTLEWAVKSLAKAGTLSIVGAYPEAFRSFPLGAAMMKNLTVRMGRCNHRKYIPILVETARTGVVDPLKVLTRREPPMPALEAYKAFDRGMPGWMRVKLEPAREEALA